MVNYGFVYKIIHLRFIAGEEVVYNGELWVCLQDHTFYQMNWNRDYIDLYWQKV